MHTIAKVEFEDYADWYLKREDSKGGRKPSTIPRQDLRYTMKKNHPGKLWQDWESFSWEVVSITTRELFSVLILASTWTREEGLVRNGQLRTMANAVQNAISSDYFKNMKMGREKHHQRYAEYQKEPPTPDTIDRLVVRTLLPTERSEVNIVGCDVTLYLHDGIGRCLPLMTLINEGHLPEMECEAFAAIQGA